MKIAIIGSGNVGGALAKALRRAGHTVSFGARTLDPMRDDEATIAEVVSEAEVCILAIPFAAVPDVIDAAAGFAGKVLIDATNPIGKTEFWAGWTIGFDASGAETIAALAPAAKVYKTFNQTGFENMADATVFKAPPVMFGRRR